MSARKESLERKISELLGEREGLSVDLDETSEKILVLERKTREQETQVNNVYVTNEPVSKNAIQSATDDQNHCRPLSLHCLLP